MKTIHVIGAGLSGSEAAAQCLLLGHKVVLHEMRPIKQTPAHSSGDFAEVVCSNSFKSEIEDSASGLLKREMDALESLILKGARANRVPAGHALAFDRKLFSEWVTATLRSHPNLTVASEEVTEIPTEAELSAKNEAWIIATGPLTSDALATSLQTITGGKDRLFFYDAIAPTILAESIDMTKGFHASRYDNGTDDYLNLPFNKPEYEAFIDACIAAEMMPLHDFENTAYFEGCLPIEVMIERGRDTLRFGPMKPVGLTDPNTGHRPWANLQLRIENRERTMYSMVGFQTKMKWPDQKRVFSMVPGLENAEFVRFGSIHRNTYVKSPEVLASDLSFKGNRRVFLAGQLTGVEGYVESSALGILAARHACAVVSGQTWTSPPKESMLGALADYVTNGGPGSFQPMNANLGLFPAEPKRKGESKEQRRAKQCAKARLAFDSWLSKQSQTSAFNMVAKSFGLSDAPPTSAPSMLDLANSEAAF